jgi:hypothetical protein
MRIRNAFLVLAVVALALCTATRAHATQTSTDTTSGYEYYATSTDGRFVGTADGMLPGHWAAHIQHTRLCSSCTRTATITGGGFSLLTAIHGIYTLVTGNFTAGTIQVTNVGVNCTNQTFSVSGTLGGVGPWYTGRGSGTFSAALTHYRHALLRSCITYGASATGTISLTF